MDDHSFHTLYADAERALLAYRLNDALTGVGALLHATTERRLHNEYESLRSDYAMMLRFMSQGGADPQRDTIHRTLLRRVSTLLEQARRAFAVQHSADHYGRAATALTQKGLTDLPAMQEQLADAFRQLYAERTTLPAKATEEQCALVHRLETAVFEAMDDAFDFVWTLPHLSRDEEQTLLSLLETLPAEHKPHLLSALLLAEWYSFDAAKMHILLHFCQSPEAPLRARALSATLLIYMRYAERWPFYDELGTALSSLFTSPSLAPEILMLQKQLFLCLEAVRAKKKLQEEILPDLIKSKRYQRTKMGFEEIDPDLANALKGNNSPPEPPSKEDIKLAHNMKEFMKMNEEGIDVNLATFSSLKGFAFFQRLGHWLAPFNARRPEVRDMVYTADDTPIQFSQMVLRTGRFCEGDKYSLCLMLKSILPNQREFVMQQFNEKMQAEGDEDAFQNLLQRAESTESLYRSCLEDLYRFFKLSPGHSLRDDAFARDLLLTRYELPVQAGLKTPAYLEEMAGFLMHLGYHADAIDYWEELRRTQGAHYELLEKLGRCYRLNGNLSQAVLTYQQADLLRPDNENILNQLHLCYAEMGRPEQDLQCLLQLEQMEPDSPRVTSETGACLMQLGRYEEAAQRFYKLEYMGEQVMPSMRAIAWCAFKMKKLEKARHYYAKLHSHEGKVRWADYLNAGHTAWLLGQTAEALAYYRRFVALYGSPAAPAKSALEVFDDDEEELLAHGLSRSTIALIRDLIQGSDSEG